MGKQSLLLRRLGRAGLWLGLLAVATLLLDFGQFAWTCRAYTTQARRGAAALPASIEGPEAIVVLTGDHSRIPRAIELLHLRKSPLLIISGVKKGVKLEDVVNQQGDASLNIHEVWGRIQLESRSSSTVENAIETAKLLSTTPTRSVLLVTSDYHMLRALEIFQQVARRYTYYPYAVASELADLSLDLSHRTLIGVVKAWSEYWKYVLFRISR